MSYKSEKVKNWRKNTKSKMVQSMGGKCQCCGYNRCNEALEFHHIDPEQKEIEFGRIIGSSKSWEFIAKELTKCILVCSVCHKEIHAKFRLLPENYQKFDESKISNASTHRCLNCKKLVSLMVNFCCVECKKTYKLNNKKPKKNERPSLEELTKLIWWQKLAASKVKTPLSVGLE